MFCNGYIPHIFDINLQQPVPGNLHQPAGTANMPAIDRNDGQFFKAMVVFLQRWNGDGL